jgi:hypothetical protein
MTKKHLMKTIEQAWKELGVDDDMRPSDDFINGWAASMDEMQVAVAAAVEEATAVATAKERNRCVLILERMHQNSGPFAKNRREALFYAGKAIAGS